MIFSRGEGLVLRVSGPHRHVVVVGSIQSPAFAVSMGTTIVHAGTDFTTLLQQRVRDEFYTPLHWWMRQHVAITAHDGEHQLPVALASPRSTVADALKLLLSPWHSYDVAIHRVC